MLNYILRRLMLMPITLFGITLMVFLIARCSPGKPGQMQMAEGQMDAEQQQAMREWYEKRYGIDQPLHVQYWRWWRGMFTKDMDAVAWTEVPWSATFVPVFTLRDPQPAYYARLDDGSWAQVVNFTFGDAMRADARGFRTLVRESDLEHQPAIEEGYAVPTHLLLDATLRPIESLDAEIRAERLKRAENLTRVRVEIEAPGWTDRAEYVYHHPEQADRYIFERGGRWFEIRSPRVSISPVNDVAVSATLGSVHRTLPQQKDGYSIPRHAIVYGTPDALDDMFVDLFDVGMLERVMLPANVPSPAGLWVKPEGSERFIMLWEQKERIAPLFVRGDDGVTWEQLIGVNRTHPPPETRYTVSQESFRSRLDDAALRGHPAVWTDRREPRHVVFAGTRVDWPSPIDPRDIRRYQHKISIFEITLGESTQTRTTVMDEIRRCLPVTLMISMIAFPLIYMIAIPTGMLMAVKRGLGFDGVSNFVLLALWSVPTVLSATLFIGYLASGGEGWQVFPNNGLSSVGSDQWPFSRWLGDRAWHLVLPVMCIIYGGLAYLAKQMRAAMLDNFSMDYVRSAKAKGVSGKDIVFRHVLRNSLLPLITIFATILPALIAGSIIIETIFSIEGMGRLAFRAVQNRDYDVVQSLALIAGVLNLTGLLLADICYAMADPRITYR